MKTSFDASGDVIVITGGANGIGAALALHCAHTGATVVICDIDEKAASSLTSTHPRITFEKLDVGNREDVLNVMKHIEEIHGKIDGLVCGAAIQPRCPVHEMTAETWMKTIRINLDGVVWCYQAVVPGMIKRRHGSIIAYTSGLAQSGWPGASAYASSKAALIAFVKSAAKEIACHQVRFNIIAPGVIDTPQYREANAGQDAQYWQNALGVGAPQDVVGPLMFLLSDAATMTASLISRDFAYSATMEGQET